eukprot:1161752-Pelagomonas_calceolata.AAC.2
MKVMHHVADHLRNPKLRLRTARLRNSYLKRVGYTVRGGLQEARKSCLAALQSMIKQAAVSA